MGSCRAARPRPAPVGFVMLRSLLLVVCLMVTGLLACTDEDRPCANGIAVSDPTNNHGLVEDCEALLAARDQLSSRWQDDHVLNWSAGVPINQWSGVQVSTVPTSRVRKLELMGMRLGGSLPSEIGNLHDLRVLDLSGNFLSGGIPREIGDLANLRIMRLSRNQLSGEIPADIGKLNKLHTLALDQNLLTGYIPSSVENLFLISVSLTGNNLYGCIPSSLWLWETDLPRCRR